MDSSNISWINEGTSRPADFAYDGLPLTGETIRGVEIVDCPDDADAIVKAASLFNEKPEYPDIEIWQEKRMVGRIPRCAKQQKVG